MIYITSCDHAYRAEVNLKFEGLYGGDVKLTSDCMFADAVLEAIARRRIPVDICSSGNWTCNMIVRELTDGDPRVAILTPVKFV